MILMQTKAIFIDAYRELNAKKLFWLTMGLSLLIVLLLAAIGIDEEGTHFLGIKIGFLPWTTETVSREEFYLNLFSIVGITIWLTWVATILALVSTSSIIPDLISGGTVETIIAKPISRTRLFLTKYSTGLLFVALQVSVFAVASFFVIGIRGHVWEPRFFLAIPIVLAFFSYLYAVSAFIGMITKAAMPAILITCLFWAMLFVLNMADAMLVTFQVQMTMMQEQRTARIESVEANTIHLIHSEMERENPGSSENYTPTIEEINDRNGFLPGMRSDAERSEKNLKSLTLWSNVVYGVKTVLPKTGETSALLDRYLSEPLEEKETEADNNEKPNEFIVNQDELNRRADNIYRSRPLWWVLGTSFIFEGILVFFCTWRFTRRDF